jgi:hypothetical protein
MMLADEINRTPPKTQAALLEAMQEHQVTAVGARYVLPEPFFVLATQNPIEMEGTYPLPEAQLDRFMFNVSSITCLRTTKSRSSSAPRPPRPSRSSRSSPEKTCSASMRSFARCRSPKIWCDSP